MQCEEGEHGEEVGGQEVDCPAEEEEHGGVGRQGDGFARE